MPQLFKIGPYRVYFWSNEGNPLEPIHVHIAEGEPRKDATKIWITRAGKCIIANNQSLIPSNLLRNLVQVIEANSQEIQNRWISFFDQIDYYC